MINNLFNKHFGAIITAVVTVIVSLAASYVSNKQVEITQIQKDKEITLVQLEQDRRWNLDLTKFVLENSKVIFSRNAEERQRIRNIMIVTMPPEMTNILFENFVRTVSEKEKGTWTEGLDTVATINASRIYVYYTFPNENNKLLADDIANQLKLKGYFVEVEEFSLAGTNLGSGVVQYFHPKAKKAAVQAKNIAESVLSRHGVATKLALSLDEKYTMSVDSRIIWIWLPIIEGK